MRWRLLALVGIALCLGAARADAQLLVVGVTTNYEIGTDFSFVRVEVADRADARRSWHRIDVPTAIPGATGIRVAQFENVSRGTYSVTVELLDARMRTVHGRLTLVAKSDNAQAISVLIPR